MFYLLTYLGGHVSRDTASCECDACEVRDREARARGTVKLIAWAPDRCLFRRLLFLYVDPPRPDS